MNRILNGILIVFLISQAGFAKTNSHVRKEFERFENVVLPNTQIQKIHSKFTKQNYRIYVNIPATYHDALRAKYPALFMLDADYSFAMAKQITEHLSDRNHIPETFVFGIAYDGPLNYRVNRTRDYTPTHVPDGGYGPEFQKHSGGGPAFADFLEKELIPYIEKNFRLSKSRTLVGHSYGGLFASWLLVTRPKVFNGYIALSPSLWYDKRLIFGLEKQLVVKQKDLTATAFFGVGAKETQAHGLEFPMVEDMQEFVNTLQNRKYKGLKISSTVFADETHDTVFPAALTRGIMFVFGKGKT